MLWYLCLLFLPLFFYFFELSNMVFTADELKRHDDLKVDVQWIAQGRFGMYYLTKLYSSNPVMPYAGLMLSSMLSLVSIRIFFEIICQNFKSPLLISVLFISCPFLVYFYSFTTISFSFGVIYFLITMSVLSLSIKKYNSYLMVFIASVLLGLSISIYQSALTVFMSMILIVLFYKYQREEVKSKFIYNSLITFLVSLVFYFCLNKFFKSIFGINQNVYLNGFFEFDFSIQHCLSIINSFIFRMFDILYPLSNILPRENSIQIILIVCFFSILIYKFRFRSIVLSFISLCIILSTFSFEILSQNAMPIRSYIALPLLFTFLFYNLYQYCKCCLLLRVLSVFMLSLYILLNFINMNRLIFFDYMSWEKDKLYANQMLTQVFALDGLNDLLLSNRDMLPIHISGYIPSNKSVVFYKEFENVGKSFFSWGANEILNGSVLFRVLGFDMIEYAQPETKEGLSIIRSMPSWPLQGSIAIVDDFVVIKVSDYTETQINTICSSMNNNLINSCLVSYNPRSIPFVMNDSIRDIRSYEHIYQFGVEHFSGLNHSTVTNDKKEIKIFSPISDSFLILPKIIASDNLILQIDIEFKDAQSLNFYFKDAENAIFNENNVLRIRPFSGRKNLYITLPSKVFTHGFRIDFGETMDVFTIHKLNVYK